jgi:hypothetical protein
LAVEQTPATSQTAAPAPPQHQPDPGLDASVDSTSPPSPPGFGARGRVRRRARFLRKARELAYRDLGGLVFNLHRFGQRNDSLVLAKLATLSRIDAELRGLEAALAERQPVTVLREAGITACPRCAAIHSGEDRFCPNCGLPLSRRSDLPIAGMPAAAAPAAGVASAPTAGGQEATSAPSGGAGPTGAYSSPPPVAQPDPASVASAPPNPAAPPARAPTPPATKTYASVAPGDAGAGRSPAPPAAASERPAPERDDDQPTEIIRPRPGGS